jgi:hypothetical protein
VAGKPAQTADAAGSSGEAEHDRPQAPGVERFGPLALERHRKDDGRALIVFSRVASEPGGARKGDAEA